jgi:chromosome segregation ATPase
LRVTELKVKPTTAEVARLKLKCVAGQTKVKALETRVDNGITTRIEAYNNLTDRLEKLTTKLKAANVDIAKLEEETTELKTKISTFEADLAKYKVTLQDLRALGCQADPTGFKAALEAARSARATVAADAAIIRAYVKDPIKVTLADLKTNLDKNTTDDKSKEGNQ